MSRPTLSIQARLVRVVVAAIFGGVLASVTFFTVHDFRQSVLAEQARLRSSASAFAAAAADGVRAGDARAVLLVLRAIRELSNVRYAAAFDVQGSTVAEIGQATELVGSTGTLDTSNIMTMVTAQLLSVTVDIHDKGAVIGSIEFVADISGLRQQYLRTFVISIAVGLGLIAFTAILARRHVTRVIAPLESLARQFAHIGQRPDLTQRIEKSRDDEVGVLIDAFNEMFSHIERRDALLQRHRDTLEETVEVRTSELRVAKDEAERANAAKSDFLATMSHEIRTPMNGMLVMAEMLSAAPLAPKHLRYAEVITRSANSLLNIINDILDYSKIESGNLTFESVPFSLDTLIEDAASLFSERAREKGLTVAMFVSVGVPAKLLGDPTRVSQVVGNLLNNALKFTEQGGVLIDARGSKTSGDRVRIDVHVRDTGIGIASDKLGQIFDRFTQADQSITRRFGGTGLGLSISRRLVEGMGGEIGVSSHFGAGSDFFFSLTLPISVDAPSPALLQGRRIAIRCNELTARSLVDALTERGAEIVVEAPELTICDRGGLKDCRQGPVVYVRSFADTGTFITDQVLAEIAAPVRRADLDRIAAALTSNDWSFSSHGVEADPISALPDFRHLKVLAVDDNAVNREVLTEALSAFRIIPQLAEDGHAAIEMYRRSHFDIVFMDCSMPGLDGYQTTGEIREIERVERRDPSHIVALTAHVTGEEAQRWHSAGMNSYIAKPFTIARIRMALERTCADLDSSSVPSSRATVDEPLISPKSLAMFQSLLGPTRDGLIRKVFNLFLVHAPAALVNLRDAIHGNSNDVVQSAHAMKSMCFSAGAQRAALMCDEIEKRARSGRLPEPRDIEALDEALRFTFQAMNTHIAAFDLPPADTLKSA